MLSNLLPGFRNIRTPLATGALYLVLVWLWVGRPAPSTESGWFAGALQWVGLLGASTLLATAAVIAYLVGSVATIDPVVSRTNPTRAFSRCWRFASWCDIRHIYDTTEHQLMALTRIRTDQALAARVPIERYREAVFDQSAGADPVTKYGKWMSHRCRAVRKCARRQPDETCGRTGSWIELEDATVGRLFAEVPILAVQLHAKQKDLYDDYDRALSEAGFRISVMIPVTLISITVAADALVSLPWRVAAGVCALVLFYALLTRGATKVRTANDIIVQALVLGLLDSPFLHHLDSLDPQRIASSAPVVHQVA
ncbi:MAG TPA: hypothetical protein PKY70_08890 [Nakamurella multipartita]|nr:hypothetical protein [Nakamurella multipartita]